MLRGSGLFQFEKERLRRERLADTADNTVGGQYPENPEGRYPKLMRRSGDTGWSSQEPEWSEVHMRTPMAGEPGPEPAVTVTPIAMACS